MRSDNIITGLIMWEDTHAHSHTFSHIPTLSLSVGVKIKLSLRQTKYHVLKTYTVLSTTP
jgi:hypothetical protein